MSKAAQTSTAGRTETRSERILREAREISEGMRRINPAAYDEANRVVRNNMQAALRFQGQLFGRKQIIVNDAASKIGGA